MLCYRAFERRVGFVNTSDLNNVSGGPSQILDPSGVKSKIGAIIVEIEPDSGRDLDVTWTICRVDSPWRPPLMIHPILAASRTFPSNVILSPAPKILGNITRCKGDSHLTRDVAASADFSYRFLIGSGRADSARNGGGRGFAQPGRVVVDAMRARGPG